MVSWCFSQNNLLYVVGNEILVNGLVVGLPGEFHGMSVTKWRQTVDRRVRWCTVFGTGLLWRWRFHLVIPVQYLALLVHGDHQTSVPEEMKRCSYFKCFFSLSLLSLLSRFRRLSWPWVTTWALHAMLALEAPTCGTKCKNSRPKRHTSSLARQAVCLTCWTEDTCVSSECK